MSLLKSEELLQIHAGVLAIVIDRFCKCPTPKRIALDWDRLGSTIFASAIATDWNGTMAWVPNINENCDKTGSMDFANVRNPCELHNRMALAEFIGNSSIRSILRLPGTHANRDRLESIGISRIAKYWDRSIL